MKEKIASILPHTFVEGFHNESKVKQMKYSKFGETDMLVSKYSLGGSALGGVFGDRTVDEFAIMVDTAFKSGINYVDTAPFYGGTKAESTLGKILKLKKVPRESFYISTKVGRYGSNSGCHFDFSCSRVTKSVDESLQRLGLDYVDIIIVHDVEFAPSVQYVINETLPALEKLKSAGKIKYIGISGYPLATLKEIIEQSNIKIDVVLTYCHYALCDTSLTGYIRFFKSAGVGVINAAPFSMGLLSNDGPQSWHPASKELQTACKQAVKYTQDKEVNMARLVIGFSCNHEDIHTTLASSTSHQYVCDNLDAALYGLSEKEEVIIQEIKEKFLDAVEAKTWEGKELSRYDRDSQTLNFD